MRLCFNQRFPNSGVPLPNGGRSLSENDWKGNDQRRFSRVGCRLLAEFRLLEGSEVWLSADVLDFTVAGVRVQFEREQRGIVLSEADVEWKEALFRLGNSSGTLSIKGHFLRVYAQEGGCFITGAEFLDVAPELQIGLVRLYALYRPYAAGA